jgi:hypothetical protein
MLIFVEPFQKYFSTSRWYAFIPFNTDGHKDFTIGALATINPKATLSISDNETDGNERFIGREEIITWLSGTKTITADTIVLFKGTDNYTNLNFGASIGSISRSGSFKISSFKEGIIAYTAADANTPSTYLAAILIGNDHSEIGPDRIPLTATRLLIGTTIAVINNLAAPDGGKYTDSSSNQIIFFYVPDFNFL